MRAASAARRSPPTTIVRPSASVLPPSGPLRQSTDSGSYAARRRIEAQIASVRSSGSDGPSIPGIARGRNDGTVGMQLETASRCSRRSPMFASSSSGSLNSHSPIASNPAAA